jgi:hypothetical protein
MNILKQLANLFTGGAKPLSGDIGLYYYIRCDRCKEVIRVRINPMNDLSGTDDGKGYFVRKTIVGRRCYNRIEAEFMYSRDRKLIDSTISGGRLVEQAEYEVDQRAADESAGNN